MNPAVSENSNDETRRLFYKALNMYKVRPDLDPNKDTQLLEELARCASTDDVILALETRIKRLAAFRNDRWAALREKLKPVVEGVLRVVNVAGESADSIVRIRTLIAFGIPGGKGVFASVALLLAAAQAQSQTYDTLERLLERLGSFLARFNVLYDGRSSQRRPALGRIATSILAHLFYVLALSTKFLRKSRKWHYIYHLFGFSFPDALKEGLQKMDDLTNEEGLMVGAHALVAAEQNLAATEQLKEEMYLVQRVQVDENIRKWLSAPDPSIERNAALNERQDGTGDWFLQTEAFKQWRMSGGNSVLWLHGQLAITAGSGKTIISAYIGDKLLHDDKVSELAYFFFDKNGNEKAKEDLSGLLSSLLLQLATRQERHKILYAAYQSDRHKGTPARSSMLEYFDKVLAVPGNVILIIDALDEHRDPRDKLLRFLTDLSCGRHDRLRILVTSRDEADIRAAMEDIGAIEFDLSIALKQKEDIRKYVTDVLHSVEPFRTWAVSNQPILDCIKKRLFQESMFRLVALQLNRLRSTKSIDVAETLSTLPKSLMKMYDDILCSLQHENRRTARRVMHVFEIMSQASRPLTVDEVAEVFAVEFDEDGGARVLEEHRSKDPETELLRTCTSAFIQIEAHWMLGRTVRFAHASVLDYLQRNQDTSPHSSFHIDPANAASTLAKLSLCTILSMAPRCHSWNAKRPVGPFDAYASNFWLRDTKHALFLGLSDKLRLLLDSILLSGVERIPGQAWGT
ncbi:hypothetical protein M422DRAFT_70295 [Sphaerobolus stellatus SS14]|uniref:NACHT domain-containing protein n=1 Tax=Sphaerobolus stellatus (strain SS14) TaxID=990650 RepID=A0A0C9UXQ1_SPHS4|nr:hypothetical protein M422DRAFT_70295 [Sphaerobolus stellatus SS14]